jgi:hypothetical protein
MEFETFSSKEEAFVETSAPVHFQVHVAVVVNYYCNQNSHGLSVPERYLQ